MTIRTETEQTITVSCRNSSLDIIRELKSVPANARLVDMHQEIDESFFVPVPNVILTFKLQVKETS